MQTALQETLSNLVLTFGVPLIVILLAALAVYYSTQARKVKAKFVELQQEIKRLKLEKARDAKLAASQARVEAKLVNGSQGDYSLRVWNSGRAPAYNVNVKLPEYSGIEVVSNKAPFELLEPGKSFEEPIVVKRNTTSELLLTTLWDDNRGNPYFKQQNITL